MKVVLVFCCILLIATFAAASPHNVRTFPPFKTKCKINKKIFATSMSSLLMIMIITLIFLRGSGATSTASARLVLSRLAINLRI